MLLTAACMVDAIHAIDPERAKTQYVRDRWEAKEGFPGGPVYAINQTADGYLWIGTEKGLVRFDGLKFEVIRPAPPLPNGPVHDLTVDAEGNLWAQLLSSSLIYFRDGKFERVLPDPDLAEPRVTAMCRGTRGEFLFSELAQGVFKYSGGKIEKLTALSQSLTNFLVISVAETPDGDVWLGTRDAGMFRLRGRQMVAVTKNLPDRKINRLLPGADGGLWVGTDDGLVRWNGSEITGHGVPPILNHGPVSAMISDRDANIWVGTAKGLVRLNADGKTATADLRPPSSIAVTALFEDREGNIWVGDGRGIERLRERAFRTYSASEGLPAESNGPLHVDSMGRTWFAPASGGLYWLKEDQIKHVMDAGLDNDIVYSIGGSREGVWLGRQRGGLTHLHFDDSSFRAKTYTRAEGLAHDSVYAIHQSRDGAVWAGTLGGGVSRLLDGKFTTYTTADGLASNTVTSIQESADGTMWFASPGVLSALANGRWRSYTIRDGLPSENLNCLFADSRGVLWLGTDQGLAFMSGGTVSPAILRGQIMGLAEDKDESLWVATANRVLQVRRDDLLRGELKDEGIREYGLMDGLHSTEGIKRHRSVVSDPSGRIWFSLNRALSVVDPARLKISSAPAIVHISSVLADGSPVDLRAPPLRIPAARQRITIGFEGLSLSMPERVKFRYTLEGFDHGWNEPGATREAVYTNLKPGPYRFRVIASNSGGLWNGAEAAIGFEVQPAFWQTWWFRFTVGLSGLAALWGLYQLRLRQLTRQLNIRFEERLDERTRIAQELHDTLLQGFLSASMQLHVAAEYLPPDSPAKSRVGRVLELMGQVIEEGRTALQGLRSSNGDSPDLAHSLSGIWQTLAVNEHVDFRVAVVGAARPLHPLIRDEVYHIGREALVNAFRHSSAKTVAAEIEYGDNYLRLLVRDDGRGIEARVLREGRAGHWGLAGMRERAGRIGARLRISNREAGGTEVELSVPAPVAFLIESPRRLPRWFPGSARRQARR